MEKVESGAFCLSVGNAVVAIPACTTAVFYNPAGMIADHTWSAEISYRNFYGLTGINQTDLAVNFALSDQPLALGISRFGNIIYQEYQIFIAGMIAVNSKFRCGVSFQTYFLSIKGYGTDNSYGANLGMIYLPAPDLYCAAVVYNINQPVIGQNGESIPHGFSFGISYFAENRVMITGEIYRDTRFAPDYRLGISYKFDLPLIIRAGIQDTINCYCVGLGTVFSTFKLDYAVQIQQILGVSHIFSVSYTL